MHVIEQMVLGRFVLSERNVTPGTRFAVPTAYNQKQGECLYYEVQDNGTPRWVRKEADGTEVKFGDNTVPRVTRLTRRRNLIQQRLVVTEERITVY